MEFRTEEGREDEAFSRDPEQRVEQRRRAMRLEACSLPEGMTLETTRPRQVVVEGLPTWAIVLRWEGRDGQGTAMQLWHVARYDERVPEEALLRWAVKDFAEELARAGLDAGDVSDYTPAPHTSRRNAALAGALPMAMTMHKGYRAGYFAGGGRLIPAHRAV